MSLAYTPPININFSHGIKPMKLRSSVGHFVAILICASFLLNVGASFGDEPPADHDKEKHAAGETVPVVSADEAIEKLKVGNQRFVDGKPNHPHETAGWRALLEAEQHPFAVVLGCSDSRVPPELILDQGLGDLFVIRVAGNVVDTDVTASVEYAIDHLKTQLVVVLGHSGCGAVTATLQHLIDPDGEPAEVVELLYRIEPALVGIPADMPHRERIAKGVALNVERAVRRLSRVPDLRRSIKAGKLKIVGAVYDMHTGKVAYLNPPAEKMRK